MLKTNSILLYDMRKMELCRLELKPYDWQIYDEQYIHETSNVNIYTWCLDAKNIPHCLIIHNYYASMYVELPEFVGYQHMNWDQFKVNIIVRYLVEVLKKDEHQPIYAKLEQKKPLYYYRTTTQPFLWLGFPTIRAMQHCSKLLAKSPTVYGLGKLNCRVWHDNISIVRKLLTERNLSYSGWLVCEGQKVALSDKRTKLNHEYHVNYNTLVPLPDKFDSTNPTRLSIDIETYSPFHNKLPEKTAAGHDAYMCSCVYKGHDNAMKNILIVIGECDDIKDVDVRRVKNEVELIYVLAEIVNSLDPDLIVGFNIFGYDYPYLDARLGLSGLADDAQWPNMSRLIKGETKLGRPIKWKSSAYGNNDMCVLEMAGRISIDMLPIIRRNFKLEKYNLDYVSVYFLNMRKHPIKAKDMFEIYEMKDPRIRAREMARVGDYCVQDSRLPLFLMDKLYTWIDLNEMSCTVGVSIFDLFTRGQQVRIHSMVYDEAYRRGYVLTKREKFYFNYEGGYVGDPIVGFHRNIFVLDFASLYPSQQRANNACYTRLVKREDYDKIPKEHCHVSFIERSEKKEKDEDGDDSDADVEDDLDNKNTKTSGIVIKEDKYEVRFIKQEFGGQGILPAICERLTNQRDATRAKQKTCKKDSAEWIILEKRQLAQKVSNNSVYGSQGVENGVLPLIEGAATITAKGRELIQMCNKYITDNYPGSRIVYNDTDSCMIDLNITDARKIKEIGKKLAEEITKLLPPPLVFEYEAAGNMLALKKKKYLILQFDDNGNPLPKGNPKAIKKRGIISARRDNYQYMRDVYDDISNHILYGGSFQDSDKIRKVLEFSLSPKIGHLVYSYSTSYEDDAVTLLQSACFKLISRGVSWKELYYTASVGSNYKSPTQFMALYSKEMKKRGHPLIVGERLDYVLVRTKEMQEYKGKAKLKVLKGYRMRSPEMYLENSQSEPLDYMEYLEKGLIKANEQIFSIAYKKEIGECVKKHEDIMKQRNEKQNRNKTYTNISEKFMTTMYKIIRDKNKVVTELKEIFERLLRPKIILDVVPAKPRLILDVVPAT